MDHENNSTEDTSNRDSNEAFVAVENISRPITEFETTKNNEAKCTQPKESRKQFFGSMSPVGKLKFWIDIILMGCAVASLIVICVQLFIMQTQFEIQNRAWITVKSATYGEVQEGKKIESVVRFINSGNSPALNLTVHTNSEIRDIPIQMPANHIPSAPDTIQSKAVVGPQVVHDSHVTMSVPMTKKLAAGINQGTLFIYIWGTVKYEDIFGQQRETSFCLRSKPKTNKLHICKDGNYAN